MAGEITLSALVLIATVAAEPTDQRFNIADVCKIIPAGTSITIHGHRVTVGDDGRCTIANMNAPPAQGLKSGEEER